MKVVSLQIYLPIKLPSKLFYEAIVQAGYHPGKDIYLGIDAASSEFYREGSYHLASERRILSSQEMVDYYANWARQYPIINIEDGMSEEDWNGWELLTNSWAIKFN